MKRSKIYSFALILLSVALSACGPTVKVTPELEQVQPKRFAVLPPLTPDELRKERGAELERFIYALLQSRGYDLLQPDVVDRICPDSSCDREKLAREFDIDGFFVLTVEDFSRSSFGVGFYNTLAGDLDLQTLDGKSLFSAKHRESERGGVLFDSGQVFTGIQEQIENSENSGDEAFNKLAEAFSTELINSLPKRIETLTTEIDSQLAIVKSTTKRVKPNVYEVCVQGTTEADAYVVFSRDPSPRLRGVGNKEYCGIYRVPLNASDVHVELRDPFGEIVREPISFTS